MEKMLSKWKSRTWHSSVLLICLLMVRVEHHQGWGNAAASVATVSLLSALSGELEESSEKKNETRWMKLSIWCRRIDTACPGRTSWLVGNQETASWKMWTSKQSQYVNKWWGKAIFGWRNCINKDTVHRIFVEEGMPSFPFLVIEFGEQGRRQSCWKQLMREVEELPCGMKVCQSKG